MHGIVTAGWRRNNMAGGFWRIEGFNGVKRFYDRDVPVNHITVVALEGLLRALVAKHGLGNDEVLDCFLSASCMGHKDHLRICRENRAGTTVRTCGADPYFLATLHWQT
jgi:hypothetical protein